VKNRSLINALAALGVGFLASTVSSVLDRFDTMGDVTESAPVLLDGLSAGPAVVAFSVAISLLIRCRRSAKRYRLVGEWQASTIHEAQLSY
jgi:hypothetical protein